MARILVVDDQRELAELIETVLEAEGRAVEVVYGGQAALDRLAAHAYDLVVCDLQMPDVDGLAVYRAVEQLEPPRPAVLLLTGHADAPAYTDFLQATAAAILAKPVGIDELRERVRGMLADR
ncbi:MAG: response regulator [Candidatus Rokuibacteriota bacterium]